jgi:N utilization substance protein A
LGGEKVATVIVADQQLSLSIGRRGHNVRLAAKLTGWKIDIFSDSQVSGDAELAQAVDPGRLLRSNVESDATTKLLEIEDLPGMGGIVAEILRGAGFDTVEKIANADLSAVSSLPKFGQKTAAKLIETARDFLGLQKPEMNLHDTEE